MPVDIPFFDAANRSSGGEGQPQYGGFDFVLRVTKRLFNIVA